MKKIFLIIYALMISIAANAQLIFELEYTDKDDDSHYKGILFSMNNETFCGRFVSQDNGESLKTIWTNEYDLNITTEHGKQLNWKFKPIYSEDNDSIIHPDNQMKEISLISHQGEVIRAELFTLSVIKASIKRIDPHKTDPAYFLQYFDQHDYYYEILKERIERNKARIERRQGKPVTMHLIAVAATDDVEIGESAQTDLNNLQKEFSTIAKTLNINYKEYIISGNKFSKKNIENAISNMKTDYNDVVIFAYSGHGCNLTDEDRTYTDEDEEEGARRKRASLREVEETEDRFPMLYVACNDKDIEDAKLNLTSIYKQLNQKRVRLLIQLAECNNNTLTMHSPMFDNNQEITRGIDESTDKDKLKTLFVDAVGFIRASAAQVGQKALNDKNGGLFMNCLLNNINGQTSTAFQDETSWDNILARTHKVVINKAQNSVDEEGKSQRQVIVKQFRLQSDILAEYDSHFADYDYETTDDFDISDQSFFIWVTVCFVISMIVIAVITILILKKLKKFLHGNSKK